MSAYIQFATPMTDQECLIEALADLGFDKKCIEVHGFPVPLFGYEGRPRSQRAEIIIRRKHVGAVSNDIGFQRTPTGYLLIVSDYDRNNYGSAWLMKLQESYQKHESNKRARLEESRKAAEESARTRAELELRRMEEERQRLVQTQKQTVIDKAKKLGYTIQERQEGETLRLVLVKKVF